MGKTKTEFKMLMRTYTKRQKQRREAKSIPVGWCGAQEVVVSDCLSEMVTRYKVPVLAQDNYKRYSFVVTAIQCPRCNELISIDSKWDGFICNCENKRKIWEVLEVLNRNGNTCR